MANHVAITWGGGWAEAESVAPYLCNRWVGSADQGYTVKADATRSHAIIFMLVENIRNREPKATRLRLAAHVLGVCFSRPVFVVGWVVFFRVAPRF